jgi:hypothetical protein
MYIMRPTPKPETKPKIEECYIMVIDPDSPVDDTTATIMPAELKMKIGPFDPLPSVVINEKTLIFRMDSRTLWTRYSLGMINYSVSSFGDLASTPSVEKNLANSAASIGEFFIPYYGMKSGNKIGSLLTVISNNGARVVDAIKNKRDMAAYEVIWSKQIDELANYLNEINPQQYPKDLLSEQFTSLTRLWAEDFNARYNNDYITDSIALDNILKIAVSGIPNHVNKGYVSIADTLSRGVIAQFPLSFVG